MKSHVICERASEIITPGLFAVRMGVGTDFFSETWNKNRSRFAQSILIIKFYRLYLSELVFTAKENSEGASYLLFLFVCMSSAIIYFTTSP